jgi:hypothetical protein
MVTVRFRATDLSSEMAEMRGWLDRNQYEATRFDCNQNGDDIILSVGFRMKAAAEAFARHFDGRHASLGDYCQSAEDGSRPSAR